MTVYRLVSGLRLWLSLGIGSVRLGVKSVYGYSLVQPECCLGFVHAIMYGHETTSLGFIYCNNALNKSHKTQ